jgi:Helicase associated domain
VAPRCSECRCRRNSRSSALCCCDRSGIFFRDQGRRCQDVAVGGALPEAGGLQEDERALSRPGSLRGGRTLGRWVRNQRRHKRHKGENFNAASASPGDGATQPEWICRLEAIGFEWDGRAAKEAELWDQWYRMLKAFQRKHGHCRVRQRDVHGGKRLGRWVSRQRQSYKKGASALPGDGATHRERIRRLNEVGFAWDGRPTNEARRGEEPSEKLQTYRAARKLPRSSGLRASAGVDSTGSSYCFYFVVGVRLGRTPNAAQPEQQLAR